MTDPRKIIEELVALKDLHDQIEHQRTLWVRTVDLHTINAMDEDYRRRKPLAWAAARAFLAEPEAKLVNLKFVGKLPPRKLPDNIDD